MRATIRLDGGTLQLLAPEAGIGVETRPLTDGDAGRFAAWADSYRRALGKHDAQARLFDLGKQMAQWLDGGERWLERLLDRAAPPLILELQSASARLNPATVAFLVAPWELLATADGFLAQDAPLRFSPVRRIGPAETPAAPPPELCLGVAFMAASPRNVTPVLDYEAEEIAILTAVGGLPIDLETEETGNLARLAERLSRLATYQAVHLSCHGEAQPQPYLVLEDDEGNREDASADALVDGLKVGGKAPPLVFLSACLTATQAGPADPLAVALVRSVPTVLGWDGTVGDADATRFAHVLYGQLARRISLEEAVARARRALLLPEGGGEPSASWPRARLWLGRRGGGAIVAGATRRTARHLDAGHKDFLDARKDRSPVALRDAFVGRRREMQTALRVLRRGEAAGLLIHGLGRQGKSSLAARIVNRLAHLEPVVIYGKPGDLAPYTALAIADEIAAECPAARPLLAAVRSRLPTEPALLEDALRAVLEGPCGAGPCGAGPRKAPILLVIDDAEQLLDVPAAAGQPWRVKPESRAVLLAILRAFRRADTPSRLLLTCRYAFTLPDGGEDLAERLFALHLPPMDEAGRRKQARRWLAVDGLDAGLVDRAVDLAHGNPGLQELLCSLIQADTAAAGSALDEMAAYLDAGNEPEDPQVRGFLEDLVLNELLELAGSGGRELLRAMTLFDLPLPAPVVDVLAQRAEGDAAALAGLGLLDAFEDLWDARQTAFAINRLVRPKAGALKEFEAGEVAKAAVPEVYRSWCYEAGNVFRDVRSVELARLAVMARGDPHIINAAAEAAVRYCYDGNGNSVAGTQIAAESIAELVRQGASPAPWLILKGIECARRAGDGERTRHFASLGDLLRGRGTFEEGSLLLRTSETNATFGNLDAALKDAARAAAVFRNLGEQRNEALARGQIADILKVRGELDEALRIYRREELPVYEWEGDVRSRAVTMGKIADILEARGDVDEALRIRREELLPVFERIGDEHSRAVAMGQIADTLEARGELDGALRIYREEELPVYERLGAARSRAVTIGKIADILVARGDVQEALRIRWEEELPVCERLGDVRSRAVTIGKIADILVARGELDEALRIRREEELPVFERLGDVRSHAVAMGKIADILDVRGDVDEALRIRREEVLPVFERLKDARLRAVIMGKVAHILALNGDLTESRRLHEECLAVNRRLRNKNGIAAALWDLARLDLAAGNYDDALPRLGESFQAVIDLGQAEGIAVVGQTLGFIALQGGAGEQALAILRKSETAFRKLGRVAEADAVVALIAQAESGGTGGDGDAAP